MTSSEITKKATLKQLLFWFIAILLVLLMAGSFVLNIITTRSYLQNQLQSHAQDAATSLGLSLSTAIDARDIVQAERMIDAIFDSGDYLKVVYRDVHNRAVIERVNQTRLESVPDWFESLIELETPFKTAQVMSGWTQLGLVEVVSHPGYAYIELWQTIQTQTLWYGAVSVLAFVLVHVFVSMILMPLRRIERQAFDMSNRRFDYRAPEPNTRELARVSLAMNEMADTLGHMFEDQLKLIESLREQSLLDSLTALNNREGFDRRLCAELESQQSVRQGALVLIKLNDFGAINQAQGRAFADQLLKSVGKKLHALLLQHVGSFAARRNGADFSVYFPGITGDTADELANEILATLNSLPEVKQLLRDDFIYLGVACAKQDDDTRSLLSKADMALTQAQSKGVSAWQRYAHMSPEDVMDEVRQASEWSALLQHKLAEQALILHLQPVINLHDKSIAYHQVLARLDIDGQLLSAGVFLPMAERFGLMSRFDQMATEKVLSMLSSGRSSERFSVSLAESSVADVGFMHWLEGMLESHRSSASQLIFEVPEHVLNFNEVALQRLCVMAGDYGFGVSVERFGASSVPFAYLQRIDLVSVKIDISFVRHIHQSPDNQFFLRSAMQIAHSQGLKILAVGVESEQELETLTELGIDGAMGYHLGRPEANSLFDSI